MFLVRRRCRVLRLGHIANRVFARSTLIVDLRESHRLADLISAESELVRQNLRALHVQLVELVVRDQATLAKQRRIDLRQVAVERGNDLLMHRVTQQTVRSTRREQREVTVRSNHSGSNSQVEKIGDGLRRDQHLVSILDDVLGVFDDQN